LEVGRSASGRWPLNGVPWCLCFFVEIFCGVFVRFSTREVQKQHNNFLGEVHVKKLLAKKLRKETFFCRRFPSIGLSRFLAVSLHEKPKYTINIFSKNRPENLKKSQKKVSGTQKKQTMVVPTSVFF
jgi:hypothetical protein